MLGSVRQRELLHSIKRDGVEQDSSDATTLRDEIRRISIQRNLEFVWGIDVRTRKEKYAVIKLEY